MSEKKKRMRRYNQKAIKVLPFFILPTLWFIFSGIALNTAETLNFCKYQESFSLITILQSYFNITTVFCLYSILVFPVFLCIVFFNKNIAQMTISILFALLFSLEIGLSIYCKQTSVLLGAELFARPFSEIWTTLQNSTHLVQNIFLLLLAIAAFISIPFFFKRIKCLTQFNFCFTGMLIIVTLSAGVLLYQKDNAQNRNNYKESKSYYLFVSIIKNIAEKPEMINYFSDEQDFTIEKNENLLKEYIKLFNNKSIADIDYPMERPASEFPDLLSSFFYKSESPPNIVIIIVESLSSYMLSNTETDISITPFLDSLAKVGLFWKNCLSTTPRTFGVLPAVIGSVPHGIKGFQFGIMPDHHSLLSVLKNNNYVTNFFYGGDLNFDNMIDFVSAQEPDHISNYMTFIKKYKKKKQAHWWGVFDHVLFDESLDYLNTCTNKNPYINVYLTLSTHDLFIYRKYPELNKHFETKTENLLSKMDARQKELFLPVKDKIAGFIYADESIREFINNYSKQESFENTVFIITGDHSVGIQKNSLSFYSVPLIIWSPFLKKSQSFPNIVSHWAITPSIISFLQHNYSIQVPEKLAWCSDGLDTASFFQPSENILFLSYNRKVDQMVFQQYFFEANNEFSKSKLYEITENLDLKPLGNKQLKEEMHSKFQLLKYVNNYVYHNHKLIRGESDAHHAYKIIKIFENKGAIVCKMPDTLPSIHGISVFDLLPEQKIKGKYNKIKIKLMAEIMINDMVYQDHQMLLNIDCIAKNFNYRSKENITKYIASDDIECNQKYDLRVEKEIYVNGVENFTTHICVTSNIEDKYWKPDKKITISNISVLLYGK